MRTFRSRSVLRAHRVLGVGVLFASVPFAQATLERSGGILGESVDYTLSGDAGEAYILAISTNAGPTPLALLDPGDPRLLLAGLDLVSAWPSGVLAAGPNVLSIPLSLSPGLVGVPIHAQFMTLPGTTTLVDELSNPTSFRLATHGSTVATVGVLDQAIAGHTATALVDGRVLLAGGAYDDGGITVAEAGFRIFDPQTWSFEATTGAMQIGRSAHTATRLADGRVLLLGGGDVAGVVSATGDVWDPVTGLATPIAPMSLPRSQHTATLLGDGRVFVAGGVSNFDLADPLAALDSATASTAIWDPNADTWSNGPNMPDPRLGHSASLLGDGSVLIVGGVEVGSLFGIPTPSISNDCRRYFPGTNNLASAAQIGGSRAFQSQITLPNGRAVVVGGAAGSFITLTFNTLATARVFDPTSGSWTNVGSLSTARAYGTLIPTTGGLVMAGGLASVDVATGTGTTALAIEIADIAISAWAGAGDTLVERPLVAGAPIEGSSRALITGAGDDTAEVHTP